VQCCQGRNVRPAWQNKKWVIERVEQHRRMDGDLATTWMQPLHRTTRHLPAAQQFAYFAALSTLSDLTPPDAVETTGFAIEEKTWRLGQFALMRAEVAGCQYRRTAAHIRRDSIDHWMLSIPLRGALDYRIGDHRIGMRPGGAFLTALDQPYQVDRAASEWIHLYIPREILPQLGGLLDPTARPPLDNPLGHMLRDYLVLLASHLPTMRQADAPRLAQALRANLLAALAPGPDQIEAARPQLELVQMARIKRLIRDHLGAATLGPDRLCRLAGMSRSTLYRLCEPQGGVARLIQAERLRAAQRLLSDPAETRNIGQIAEAVGLFDRSSFGRMFRQNFGCSPRETRATALAGGAAESALGEARRPAPQNLAELLRSL
jgi:AraC-like DNA-binding protein